MPNVGLFSLQSHCNHLLTYFVLVNVTGVTAVPYISKAEGSKR